MPVRFAHIGDVHLGAFRDPVLRELNLQAFLRALEVTREEGASFLVIAGDLFDSNLPDMAVVDRAARALKELREAGVAIYAFYGSHDRSPTERGMVDVLASAGLFENVGTQGREGDEEGPEVVAPRLVTDPGTGAVLTAVGGRKLGLETRLLETLDAEALSREVEGAPLAIFGFHGAVEGMLPPELAVLEALPPARLPRGFHYYALGHIHAHRLSRLKGGALAAYPGPTFGATFADVFDGRPKGLLIVDADDGGRCEARHVPIEVAPVERVDVDCEGLEVARAREKVTSAVAAVPREGSVVMLKVRGTLASGRPAEMDLASVGQAVLAEGARAYALNRSGLREAEPASPPVEGASPEGAGTDAAAVARAVLAAHIDAHASPVPWLRGEDGRRVALELLEVLRQERGDASRDDHERRVVGESLDVLRVEDRAAPGPGADGDGQARGGAEAPAGRGQGLDRWMGGEGP